MRLHTAEINALKNRIDELGGNSAGTLHLQRKLRGLYDEDARTIEKLVPKAVSLIESKLGCMRCGQFIYKESGVSVLVVHRGDTYSLYANDVLMMCFSDVASLARFMLVAEDMIFETIVEDNLYV